MICDVVYIKKNSRRIEVIKPLTFDPPLTDVLAQVCHY